MKKYICCIHDKKADVFNDFMLFDNMSQALKSFQMACEKNDVFQKWPNDYQFVLVAQIGYENGEIDEKSEIVKQAKFLPIKEHNSVIAEAKDYVAIKNAKNNK